MATIIVKSVPPTFRRAGIQFTRAGVTLDTETLTAEQQAAIEAEPNLKVNVERPADGTSSETLVGDGSGTPLPPIHTEPNVTVGVATTILPPKKGGAIAPDKDMGARKPGKLAQRARK